MKRRSLTIGLSLALAAAIACGASTPEPVAPPTHEGQSSAPRFEGVYATRVEEGKGGWDLLRFFPGGKVWSVSTTGTVESAAEVLYGTDASLAGTGTYQVDAGVLRFVLKSKLGSVEYAGIVHDDKLTVRWRSAINDVSQEETFTFVAVQENEPSAESDAGTALDAAPAAADASQPTAAPSAEPDAGGKADVRRPVRRPKVPGPPR